MSNLQTCRPRENESYFVNVKSRHYRTIKKLESTHRAAIVRSRGKRGAARVQRRVSLVGNGAKWRITNLPQVFAAMAKWA